jgi:hypothetical protein
MTDDARPKGVGLWKLVPADGTVIAHSPHGGIGTLRFKSNCRKRYSRNEGPAIVRNDYANA